MTNVHKADAQWREELTEEQYRVLRGKATEPPFSGNLVQGNEPGIYVCVACGAELFRSEDLYESKQQGLEGWPSFAEVSASDAVTTTDDYSYGMHRIEISCANCGGHIGHYFDDDTSPTGKHFCVNAVTLDFKPQQADDKNSKK